MIYLTLAKTYSFTGWQMALNVYKLPMLFTRIHTESYLNGWLKTNQKCKIFPFHGVNLVKTSFLNEHFCSKSDFLKIFSIQNLTGSKSLFQNLTRCKKLDSKSDSFSKLDFNSDVVKLLL